jgi:hypothetical protein
MGTLREARSGAPGGVGTYVGSVSRGAWRRWSIVASGTALLCALPAVIAVLPVSASPISAPALRARILASAGVPYEGYAESTVNLGLPLLPGLHDVSLLLDGTTDQYVWYRSPAYWRADDVTGTGESDTYADGGVTYLWNYGTNLLTQVTGAEPARLPRAPDLLPPALARRLLDTAGRADRISRLPARRIAGVDAAGLRLVPAGSGTTIGAVDIWADPASGLPLEVQITGRGTAQPVLISTFLELSRTQPDLAAVIPHPAPDVGLTTTRLPNVDGVLNGDGDGDGDSTPFPAQLGGLRRVALPGSPSGVAIYGTGFSRFVLLPLPRGVGTDALNAAIQAGAGSVPLAGTGGSRAGTQAGVLIRTPLLSVLMVRAGFHHAVFLFTGAVTPAVLENSAGALVTDLTHRFRFPR